MCRETWKGRDLYLWMNKVVQMLADWQGKSVVSIFDFGKIGDLYNFLNNN